MAWATSAADNHHTTETNQWKAKPSETSSFLLERTTQKNAVYPPVK
jgi:hypothetical protein